jgi:hypothetical protein
MPSYGTAVMPRGDECEAGRSRWSRSQTTPADCCPTSVAHTAPTSVAHTAPTTYADPVVCALIACIRRQKISGPGTVSVVVAQTALAPPSRVRSFLRRVLPSRRRRNLLAPFAWSRGGERSTGGSGVGDLASVRERVAGDDDAPDPSRGADRCRPAWFGTGRLPLPDPSSGGDDRERVVSRLGGEE